MESPFSGITSGVTKGGIESEYFSYDKTSYLSRIDIEDERYDGSMVDDKLNLGTGDTQLNLSNRDKKKGDGLEADAAGGGGGDMNVISKVASFKSILSVSNIVSINSNASSANVNNATVPQTPVADRSSSRDIASTFRSPVAGNSDRFKSAMKSPLASASKRPKTKYITTHNAASNGHATQSLDYSLLNELDLKKIDLNGQRGGGDSTTAAAANDYDSDKFPHWRMKERMKTTGVGLILALNIGTDPPDVIKPFPSARLQCWMDPSSTSRSKALLTIGELLEAQYAKWQGTHRAKIKVKRALDPTVEDVRNTCNTLRRSSKNDRVLLHYNGHGVPRPTINGEIWVFDKNHTQYIPFAVADLKHLVGSPSMFVLDCSGAGALLPFLISNDGVQPNEEEDSNSLKNVIVLCPTSHQNLPMNPELPADLFTSCLTTPIQIALKWFIRQNPLSCAMIDPESVENMDGKLNDRKTPLGELNWIFTAITDSIAWNVLPISMFQSLFRQDLMVASMFRNFLLADRILRELHCSPTSYPALPSTCDHPLWQAWDLAVETCISQMAREGLLGTNRGQHTRRKEDEVNDDDDDDGESNDASRINRDKERVTALMQGKPQPASKSRKDLDKAPQAPNISAPFFAEQLTAFEKWLEFSANRMRCGGVILPPPQKQHENFVGMQRMASFMYPGMSQNIESPEQLPVVLQVLLSPTHRVRALVLLRRFLYLGPSAVNLALSVGICPYVLRLLQSPIDEYKHLLVGIWSKILFFDHGCKNDLVKDGALPHFIRHLEWNMQSSQGKGGESSAIEYGIEDRPSHQRTMAAVILSAICSDEKLSPSDSTPFTLGQTECVRRNLHGHCCKMLEKCESGNNFDFPSEFRMWLCICLGVICKDNITAQSDSLKKGVHAQLFERMKDDCSDVRAAACFALGCLICSSDESQSFPADLNPTSLTPTKGQPNLGRFVANAQSVPSALPWQQQPFSPMQAQPGVQPYALSPLPNAKKQHAFVPHSPLPNTQDAQKQRAFVPQISSRESTPFQAPRETVIDSSNGTDMLIWDSLLSILEDASPIVRYEASVVLGRLVRRHLHTFLSIAKNTNDDDAANTLKEIELKGNLQSVTAVWKKIRSLHESDPHPKVASANTSILRFVNEKLLFEDQQPLGLETGNVSDSNLVGSEPDNSTSQFKNHRTMSAMNLTVESAGSRGPTLTSIVENDRLSSPGISRSATSATTSSGPNSSGGSFLFTKDNYSSAAMNSDSILPKSAFYEWKKEMFQDDESFRSEKCADDPLNEADAIILHREQRNAKIDARSKLLSEKYAVLRPVPKKKKSVFDVEGDEPDEAEIALEAEIASRKKSLNLKERTLLSYSGTKMTHMLCFHSYESILAASDGANNISVWDIKRPTKKMKNITNGNAGSVKMTSMSWMNERHHSLLLTGCDDGSVRVWDNVVDSNLDQKSAEAVLATSFFALPESKPPQGASRGSGLVTEWQQSEGRLIAGGNANTIRCWDMHSEKCSNIIDSEVNGSCVTSFVTAWDYIQNETESIGFTGIGPDIILGGYGDGRIKVFDLRINDRQGAASSMSSARRKLRQKDHIHKNWIVNLAYTHSPTKYEVSARLTY